MEKKKLCQRRVSVPDLPGHRLVRPPPERERGGGGFERESTLPPSLPLQLPPLIFTPGTDPEKVAAVEEKLIMTTRAARVKRETKVTTPPPFLHRWNPLPLCSSRRKKEGRVRSEKERGTRRERKRRRKRRKKKVMLAVKRLLFQYV